MRTYTLVFSTVVHAAVACVALFSTVLATDELPDPRRASVFVQVFAPPPRVPTPAARPKVTAPAAVESVPLEAPSGFHPEPDQPLVPDTFEPAPDGVLSGLGVDASVLVRDEPPPPPPALLAPIRIGGTVRPPAKLVHVSPVYPLIARTSHVTGVVILEATIGEDGSVREVRVLRSKPLLDQAAVDAVRQWRFTPTLLNDHPVPVLMTVTVSFALD